MCVACRPVVCCEYININVLPSVGCNAYARNDWVCLQFRSLFLGEENYGCYYMWKIYILAYLISSAHVQFFTVATFIYVFVSASL